MKRFNNRTELSQPIHAFTLIELLVVAAIIAVLVAILLPVLAKARSAAYLITCVNNERQLALGMLAYEGEYGRLMYVPNGYGGNWGGRLCELDQKLNRYVRDPNLYCCSRDRGWNQLQNLPRCGDNTYWDDWGNSYFYNVFGVDNEYGGYDDNIWTPQFGFYTKYPPAPNDGRTSAVLAEPVKKILVVEMYWVWAMFAPTNALYSPSNLSWHSDDTYLTTIGFLDGHASTVDMNSRSRNINSFNALDGSYQW